MSLFFSYLKQQLKYILLFLLFSITFAITFFFYNFPLEALTYPTLLCVCFGLFFFIWDFSKTKALHTRLMELSNLTELSVDMIRALPQSDSIENTDYQLLLSGLAEQILELKTAQSTRLTDMIDYYTVWVHQIKTPISSMRLTLQNEDSLLARKLSCDLSHIEQYVEMVLAFLRLDSNSSDYVFKMHELDPLLRQSIRRFSSEFINRKLILSYTPPSDESGTLKMITDDKWFCFVIEQLLSNALKYTLPLVLAGMPYKKMHDRLVPIAERLGINSLLKKYPYEVSGGQKQRAAAARALITNPKLILADEPTGALDSKASDELLSLFSEINRTGQTIVMVTHSVKAASTAGRVLFIRDGEVFHQIYRGNDTDEQLYQKISDTLTLLATGGDRR